MLVVDDEEGIRRALGKFLRTRGFDVVTAESGDEALSQLGGQDRLVGVITHVSELAGRLPVRIEVQKLPGGSRLERAS